MSTLAFGALMRKREEADANVSTAKGKSPGLSTYVDTLAALVPAEVIAAHAAILNSTTTTTTDPAGQSVTTITDPGTLKVAFWVLVPLTMLLYAAGFQKRTWTWRSTVGLFIPPLAFVAWTMVQKPTAFVAAFPDVSQPTRSTIVILAALALGAVASLLPASVDRAPSTNPSDPSSPPSPPPPTKALLPGGNGKAHKAGKAGKVQHHGVAHP